MISDSVGS